MTYSVSSTTPLRFHSGRPNPTEKRSTLTEADVLQVLGTQAKQRREAIEQYRAGGREELAMQFDLSILEPLANSITLTPGTITTGTEGEVLRIHALTWHDVDGREEDEMDRRISALDPRT